MHHGRAHWRCRPRRPAPGWRSRVEQAPDLLGFGGLAGERRRRGLPRQDAQAGPGCGTPAPPATRSSRTTAPARRSDRFPHPRSRPIAFPWPTSALGLSLSGCLSSPETAGEETLPAHWRHVMLGLMQQQPLMISSLLSHAARHHGGAEVVSATHRGTCIMRPGPRRSAARGGWRACCKRLGIRPQRPRRHAGVERLPPPGGVLRRAGHAGDLPHHQPAAAPGRHRLHHQPCRRPRAVRRYQLRRR